MVSTISVIGSHSVTSANRARVRSDDDDDDDEDCESVAEARESAVCFVSDSDGNDDEDDAVAEADDGCADADPITDDCDDDDDDDNDDDDIDETDVDDAETELEAGCRFAATDASADAAFIRNRSLSAARLRAISNSRSRSCQRARSAALASPTEERERRWVDEGMRWWWRERRNILEKMTRAFKADSQNAISESGYSIDLLASVEKERSSDSCHNTLHSVSIV